MEIDTKQKITTSSSEDHPPYIFVHFLINCFLLGQKNFE